MLAKYNFSVTSNQWNLSFQQVLIIFLFA
jgi:hypothetical protein